MSILSRQILAAVAIAKAQPNSEWKNRTVSNLQNALACANMIPYLSDDNKEEK